MPGLFEQSECKNSELFVVPLKDRIKISELIHQKKHTNLNYKHYIAHDEDPVRYRNYIERNLLTIELLKKILAGQKITLSQQTYLSSISVLEGTIVFKKSVLLDSEKNSRCVIL